MSDHRCRIGQLRDHAYREYAAALVREYRACVELETETSGHAGQMGHDHGMRSRVNPKYKTKYRVSNWSEYDRALVRRGDITLWI
jgi:hypothetical protein